MVTLEQSRYQTVESYIVDASAKTPVTGLDTTTLVCRIKKKDESSFTVKTFFAIAGSLASDISIGDTQVTFDVLSELNAFPMSGKLWFDKGGGNEEGPLEFSRISGLSYLTLASGVTADHTAAEVITLHDFWEVGYGVYTFLLSPSNTDTLGSLAVVSDPVNASYENYVNWCEVVTATSSGIAPEEVSLSNCLVYGYITDAQGTALENISVGFRLVSSPETAGNIGVSERSIEEKTDSSGFFSVNFVQGAEVDVWIPEINFRRVVTIPSDDSAELFYLT